MEIVFVVNKKRNFLNSNELKLGVSQVFLYHLKTIADHSRTLESYGPSFKRMMSSAPLDIIGPAPKSIVLGTHWPLTECSE